MLAHPHPKVDTEGGERLVREGIVHGAAHERRFSNARVARQHNPAHNVAE